jgi:hypothetical protein
MGSRTPDLLIANETLYQLSYDPDQCLTGHYYHAFSTKGKLRGRSIGPSVENGSLSLAQAQCIEQLVMSAPRILYCHCAYAQVVPRDVKEAVLKKLCDSNEDFETVADLCEMSARRDPALKRLAEAGAGPLKIAACYPRAVKWLFAAAGAPLPKDATEVLNMRTQLADEVTGRLSAADVQANLPPDKVKVAEGQKVVG